MNLASQKIWILEKNQIYFIGIYRAEKAKN